MQSWFAVYRTWADEDEQADGDWSVFGLHPDTGHPIVFLGNANEALLQLRDELRPVITASTKVESNERRLLLTRQDDEFSGEEFLEYRLVDRAHRPKRDRKPQPVVRSASTPNRFLSEFQDVAADVAVDLEVGLAHLDEDVGAFIGEALIHAMDIDTDDPAEIVGNVMTLMFWVFLLGREHRDRGYRAPKTVSDDDVARCNLSAARRRLNEHRAKGLPGWFAAEAGSPRGTFRAEFHEITGDVIVDYQQTILDLDQDVVSISS